MDKKNEDMLFLYEPHEKRVLVVPMSIVNCSNGCNLKCSDNEKNLSNDKYNNLLNKEA